MRRTNPSARLLGFALFVALTSAGGGCFLAPRWDPPTPVVDTGIDDDAGGTEAGPVLDAAGPSDASRALPDAAASDAASEMANDA